MSDPILQALEAMRGELGERFDRIDKRLDNLDRNDGLLDRQVQGLSQRVGGVEVRLNRLEEDHVMAKRVSQDGDQAQSAALTAAMHIHGTALTKMRSETDAKLKAQDVELAAIKAETLKQTENIDKIVKLLGNPMLRRVLWLIGLAIMGWLSSKGIK